MSRAQLTLTAFLLAFGFSQLFWGPLSDHLGRKPVLLGLHLDSNSTTPLPLGVWFWSACTTITAWTLVQRFGISK